MAATTAGPEEDHDAGGYVRQVVDRIAQQPDRTSQDGQQQLDQAGGAQADRADGNGTIGLPPFAGVVSGMCQRKRQGWVTLPQGLCIPSG